MGLLSSGRLGDCFRGLGDGPPTAGSAVSGPGGRTTNAPRGSASSLLLRLIPDLYAVVATERGGSAPVT